MFENLEKEWHGKKYTAVRSADGGCEGCNAPNNDACRFLCSDEWLTAGVIWFEVKEGDK